MSDNETLSTEQKREIGKAYFFKSGTDIVKRREGLKLIIEAQVEKDPEATFIVALLCLDGAVHAVNGNNEETALYLMRLSAEAGWIQARAFLNSYCEKRYQAACENLQVVESKGGLIGFDGKPIKINRKGILTPIDAVLENENGLNVLTLSTNVVFYYSDDVANQKKFEQAVYDGILAWQGNYEVFGGQKLEVRVKLTNNQKAFDSLIILPITEDVGQKVKSFYDAVGMKKKKERIDFLVDNKFSFVKGKWKTTSRKLIFLQSKRKYFDDYEQIMHTTKHEFGHTLGLGDLYACEMSFLSGVERGTYKELDSYVITDKLYNLVMCDGYGPISNNDIEMVILAYKENKVQLYQQQKNKGKISSALGKGN